VSIQASPVSLSPHTATPLNTAQDSESTIRISPNASVYIGDAGISGSSNGYPLSGSVETIIILPANQVLYGYSVSSFLVTVVVLVVDAA
jgi:hypothetical protein